MAQSAPLTPDAAPLDGPRVLVGPRSRYTMAVAFHLYPPDTPPGQMLYDDMPELLRQLYRDWRVPQNRFILAAAWQAEICPKTRRPHIQLFIETRHKTPTPVELLHYLSMQDRNACGFKHPYEPEAAWHYCLKVRG